MSASRESDFTLLCALACLRELERERLLNTAIQTVYQCGRTLLALGFVPTRSRISVHGL